MTHRLDLNQAKSVSPLTAAKNGQATEPTHNPAPGLDLEAMEQLPYAMGMMEPGGRALFVNDAIVRMLGYPDAQSLLNTPVREVIAQPQAFLRLIELMETHGVARGYEIELVRYNGKSIWMVVTVHEVVTVNGLAWQIALIDITDRILAERADAESRDRYQTVFEQSPSALWQIDFSALQGWFDGLRAAGVKDLRDHLERHPEDAEQACSLVRVVDVNPAGVALAGVGNKERLLGKLRPPETDTLSCLEQALAIWDGHTEFETETSSRTRDGRDAIQTIHMAVPAIGGELNLSQVMISVHDITGRVAAEAGRSAAERQFQEAFTGAPIGMILVNLDGEIAQANPAFGCLVGHAPLDLVGAKWQDLIHPDDVQTVEPQLPSLRAGESPMVDVEMRIVRGDGTMALVSVRASIVRNGSDDPVSVIAQVVDMTELHKSHTALKQLVETLPTALYRTTPAGELIEANPAMLKLLGYPDLATARATNLLGHYADPAARNRFKALMDEEGAVRSLEIEVYHASGETIWVHDSATRQRDAVTNEVYYEGTLTNVTEQKLAHLELAASEEWRRTVFERSPVALFEEDFSKLYGWIDELRETGITDVRQYLTANPEATHEAVAHIEILDANPAAVRLLEADSVEQLLGPIKVTMSEPAGESFVEQVVAVAEGRNRLFLETTGSTFSGRKMDIAVLWVLGPGDQANSSRVLIAVMDTTERQEAERKKNELARTKDGLIASVAHELRTPLTGLLGFAQEMRENWDNMTSSDRRDYVDIIAQQSNVMSNILDDLLVAARIDVDRLTLDLTSVDLHHQVLQVLQGDSFEKRGVSVLGRHEMAWADKFRVRQILRNLISNSREHGGPNIEVVTSSDRAYAAVTVRDDGSGIAPIDIDQVFERYNRIDASVSQPASIGLGLHLARNLARLMGGDITYQRVEGWTEFTLTLAAPPDLVDQ